MLTLNPNIGRVGVSADCVCDFGRGDQDDEPPRERAGKRRYAEVGEHGAVYQGGWWV